MTTQFDTLPAPTGPVPVGDPVRDLDPGTPIPELRRRRPMAEPPEPPFDQGLQWPLGKVFL
jgi:hypothetical protein